MPARRTRHCRGHAYVEVLVATVLLVMVLVPALDALHSGLLGAEVEESLAVQQHRLAGRLEEVAAEPFSSLAAEVIAAAGAETSYSDAPGTPARRLVYLSFYDADDADGDGDPSTGGEPDIVRVRVEIEGTPHAFETLVTL